MTATDPHFAATFKQVFGATASVPIYLGNDAVLAAHTLFHHANMFVGNSPERDRYESEWMIRSGDLFVEQSKNPQLAHWSPYFLNAALQMYWLNSRKPGVPEKITAAAKMLKEALGDKYILDAQIESYQAKQTSSGGELLMIDNYLNNELKRKELWPFSSPSIFLIAVPSATAPKHCPEVYTWNNNKNFVRSAEELLDAKERTHWMVKDLFESSARGFMVLIQRIPISKRIRPFCEILEIFSVIQEHHRPLCNSARLALWEIQVDSYHEPATFPTVDSEEMNGSATTSESR